MAFELIGYAKAHIPSKLSPDGKTQYIAIGRLFRDGSKFSLKLDSTPLPGSGWNGWVNIFPPDERSDGTGAARLAPINPDDIPY